MKYSILKPIVAGALIGAALFFAPFLVLRIILFVLIFGLIFRLFIGRRYGRFGGPSMHPGFAEKIRSMSDEEYAQFKQKFNNRCRGHNYQQPQSNPL